MDGNAKGVEYMIYVPVLAVKTYTVNISNVISLLYSCWAKSTFIARCMRIAGAFISLMGDWGLQSALKTNLIRYLFLSIFPIIMERLYEWCSPVMTNVDVMLQFLLIPPFLFFFQYFKFIIL